MLGRAIVYASTSLRRALQDDRHLTEDSIREHAVREGEGPDSGLRRESFVLLTALTLGLKEGGNKGKKVW